jgi:hypothetical protein
VTVSNAGPSTAADAKITDALPAGTTFVSEAHPTGWSCTTPAAGANGTITCGPARLARGTSATFTFVVFASPGAAGTTVHNAAQGSSTAIDPHPEDNTSATDTEVKCDNNISSAPGPLTLSGGGSWCLVGGQFPGAVTVSSGTVVIIVRSTIKGSLSATSGGLFALCGSSVGSVSVSSATGFVLIGDPGDDQCAGNTLGALTLSYNRAGVEVSTNRIGGGVRLIGNTGAGPFPEDARPSVESNTIGGPLTCTSNSPTATNNGHPNSVSGGRSGECGAPGF